MRIACVLGQGFEDSEFRVPYDRLKEEGYQVDVIGVKAGEELKGYKGKEKVKADKSIDQVKAEDYDALLIPGGQSPDHLRVDRRIVDFVKKFDQAGKLIAAVCHGPHCLIAAHLVKGRTLTAWQTIQDDLQQIGATGKDEPGRSRPQLDHQPQAGRPEAVLRRDRRRARGRRRGPRPATFGAGSAPVAGTVPRSRFVRTASLAARARRRRPSSGRRDRKR